VPEGAIHGCLTRLENTQDEYTVLRLAGAGDQRWLVIFI